jgi:hypothetical protein
VRELLRRQVWGERRVHLVDDEVRRVGADQRALAPGRGPCRRAPSPTLLGIESPYTLVCVEWQHCISLHTTALVCSGPSGDANTLTLAAAGSELASSADSTSTEKDTSSWRPRTGRQREAGSLPEPA